MGGNAQRKAMIKVTVPCDSKNNNNDMDYWKLQTFYQAGKMELLENKYIITHSKYQEACLEIAGRAHFEHQILHSYTPIDIQKK